MNISAPFIRRPVATSLLAAAILVAGGAAYTRLAVAPLPKLDFPTISVNAALPGASPETMASAIAMPLERRFGRIAGLTEMTSTSTLGSTSVTLQFDLDRDPDSAARDVQAAINAAGGELPPNLPTRPNYRKVNPADAPVLIISLKSKSQRLSEVFDAANSVLAQKIAQVPGVGQVFIGGGQQPAVRVQVDPAALAGVGLGMEDARTALAQLTADHPKGIVSSDTQAQSIAANDQLFGASNWRNAVLAERGGVVVRVGDVAHVIDSVENERAAAWEDGERTVVMVIRRKPGANIIEVIERVKRILPGLAHSISPAIDVELALDRSQTIRASVTDVEQSLLISVLLVVGVVFLFLRNARATIIPSVAVPLSLLATFGVMWLLDYSLDNLSLMALTISTGFVVDDAIVVTENVARLVESGVPPTEAALRGARQIGYTIVSITVSLLAVFIPILLMGGVIGRLFREFAVTLSVAIGVSAVVSLTLTPMMCARLLRHEPEARPGLVARVLERGFDKLLAAYARSLDFTLRHRVLVGIVTIATIVLTVALYIIVPKGLFPQQDTGSISGFSDAPQDISFGAMKAREEAMDAIVHGDPDIDHAVSFIGTGPSGGTTNTGSMFIALKPWKDRKATSDEIINRLRPKLLRTPGINLFLQSVQDVRLGGRPTRTQYQYTLQDANLDELRVFAPKMLAKLRGLPELRDVASDQQTAGLQVQVKVDRESAARLGVTARDVDAALYDAFGQRQVATTYTQLNQYRVVLEMRPDEATGPDALSRVYVRASTGATAGSAPGAQIPLSAIASFSASATMLSVNHQGQFPAVTISFNTAPSVPLGPAVDAIRRAEAEIGMPVSVHADFQGTAQAYKASLASEPMLILAALITVYIVLGILYESFIHPITILSTLPSAGLGALLALLVTHTELSIIALIGIILLIGIVKKNAIMMIDFAIELQGHAAPAATESSDPNQATSSGEAAGLDAEAAIRKAALLRFRPILMTTLAALLGGLPLALGHGSGSELRQPLGIAIVGGLLLSQVLTLFTTPVTWLALDRFSRRPRDHRPSPTPTTSPSSSSSPASINPGPQSA